jgi:hypothetical protein
MSRNRPLTCFNSSGLATTQSPARRRARGSSWIVAAARRARWRHDRGLGRAEELVDHRRYRGKAGFPAEVSSQQNQADQSPRQVPEGEDDALGEWSTIYPAGMPSRIDGTREAVRSKAALKEEFSSPPPG